MSKGQLQSWLDEEWVRMDAKGAKGKKVKKARGGLVSIRGQGAIMSDRRR